MNNSGTKSFCCWLPLHHRWAGMVLACCADADAKTGCVAGEPAAQGMDAGWLPNGAP
jgi:hypothetical protein